MKKILTITFHKANNYGAVLQAYALQKELNKKYDSKILDYDNKFISNEYVLFKKNDGNLKSKLIRKVKDILKIYKAIRRINSFNKFRKKIKLFSYNEFLNSDVNNIDCCIAGSDQIWNPKFTGGFDDIYFLRKIDKSIKKISYAASSCEIKDDLIGKKIIENIKDINSLSVREETLNNYIRQNSNIKSTVVVDPVFLLEKGEWKKLLIKNNRLISKKYIFAYSVGNATDLYYFTLNTLAKKTGYKIIYFDVYDLKIKHRKKSCYQYGPEEFINLLYYSEFVVTTSFHGFALSSIFNKKMFITLSSHSDRLVTSINNFKLNNFVVNDKNDIDRIFNGDFDWTESNKLIKQKREESINWLIDAIEN